MYLKLLPLVLLLLISSCHPGRHEEMQSQLETLSLHNRQDSRFKILDRTTILWIDEHLMDNEHPNPDVRNDTLHFWKSSQLPPPYTEMKKKRWLWQNKKDWEAYKVEVQAYKKQQNK